MKCSQTCCYGTIVIASVDKTHIVVIYNKLSGMLAVISIRETREHVDARLGYNKDIGWCMIAVASVGCNNVVNHDKVCSDFSFRNPGRPLGLESYGSGRDLTGLY